MNFVEKISSPGCAAPSIRQEPDRSDLDAKRIGAKRARIARRRLRAVIRLRAERNAAGTAG